MEPLKHLPRSGDAISGRRAESARGAGRAGRDPGPEGGHVVGVAHRDRRAAGSRIPPPQDELVVRDVALEGGEVFAAVLLRVLDRAAELSRGDTDEDYLVLGRR